MHGRPEPLTASHAIEQDLDHIGPAHADNYLVSRRHDPSPQADNVNPIQKTFGVGRCQRFLAFDAYSTPHLRAGQEHFIIGLYVAGIEAEIGRTMECNARIPQFLMRSEGEDPISGR